MHPGRLTAIVAAAVAAAIAVLLAPAGAGACPRLPDGWIYASPVNFGAGVAEPVPANGALAIRVECPDCITPCQAAQTKIAISVQDDSGRAVAVHVTEQVFLDHQPYAHLVVVRPRSR